MDSSIPQVTLKGSTSEQSAGQSLASVKKSGKANGSPTGPIDLIGGLGSFASLLSNKGYGEKEGAAGPQVESAAGNNEVGNASISSINGSSQSFFLNRAMGHEGIEAIPIGTEISSDKNAKTSSGVPITGDVSEAQTKGKWDPEISGKTQILKGDEMTGEETAANLPKGSYAQEEEALRSGSVSELGKKILLKQGSGGFSSAEKTASAEAKLSDGEASSESAVLSKDSLEGNSFTGKNAADRAKGFSGTETEDQKYRHDLDPLKGLDVTGSSNSKVSSDLKGSEMLSINEDTQNPADVVKNNSTSAHQVQADTEKIENYKNLSTAILKSGRSLENAANDTQTGKTGSPLSTAQTDLSMVNGVWNDVRTSTSDRIAATLSFQKVAGQIIDGASNMLTKGSSRIVITLEPPNLGTLNMDVSVQHDKVKMSLVTDNYEVKQVLNSNLDQLKTALQGQGLNIDRLDVLVHDRSYGGNQGFQSSGGALFDDGRGGSNDTREEHPAHQILQAGWNELNEPSSGSISLFV
ncbi:MAG: flagellar hook-length control protein FliK [Syntrophales bacterium]